MVADIDRLRKESAGKDGYLDRLISDIALLTEENEYLKNTF
jgi:hypothetical protein